MKNFRVLQIDHVELSVTDRYEAADWYKQVLGLEILPDYEHWAADPGGPVMISSDDGSTKLALFEGPSQGAKPIVGFYLVAFRVDACGFVEFLKRLKELQLLDHRGSPVTSDSIADHAGAFSIYFSDRYGNRLEVTTYDYQETGKALAEFRQQAD